METSNQLMTRNPQQKKKQHKQPQRNRSYGWKMKANTNQTI